MLWEDAKVYCESLGGHLVTIGSAEENEFVAGLARSIGSTYTAIGFTDEAEEGQWVWVTGEDITYTNWVYPEPNNGTGLGVQDHAYMYSDGTWDDGFYGKTEPFICEWEDTGEAREYQVLTSTGWNKITLDTELGPDNGTDTDGDGLTDWEEVRTELLAIDDNGRVILLAFREYMKMFGANMPYYVENALNRFAASENPFAVEVLELLYNAKILPISSNPAYQDSDGDGLFDGRRQIRNGKVLLPVDPNPLKYDGPEGIWLKQKELVESGKVQTDYVNDPQFVNHLMNQVSKHADTLVDILLKNSWVANEDLLTLIKMYIKPLADGNVQEIAGADFLEFIFDTDLISYHSQVKTWQRAFGYNDIYDKFFEYGTKMKRNKISFIHNGEEHILWSWKGDYWNLQSSAETGLYVYNRTVNGIKHYDVVPYELPMTLSLYNINDNNIKNVFFWAPNEPQWWVTGFNPYYTEADSDKMTMVCSVDFSDKPEVYWSLKGEYRPDKEERIFDDEYHTIWIIF